MRAFLETTARQAGALLKRHFLKKNGVKYKAHREIVQDADLAADHFITRRIRSRFRGAIILSEEQRPPTIAKGDGFWIVDPLDGTTNFTHGTPIFGVNIAHISGGDVAAGVSHLPMTGDTFSAEAGKGAWRNGKRIRVSSQRKLHESTVILCHGYSPADMRRGAKLYSAVHPHIRYCRMFGSAAFEMSMVASGAADAFVYTGPKPWDIAPGVLLITEAGGTVTDELGRAWVPGRNARVLICSNGKLHDELLRIITRSL